MHSYGASVTNRVHLMRPEMYNVTLCGLHLDLLGASRDGYGRDLIQRSNLDPHTLPKYVMCRSCLKIDKKQAAYD